MSAVIRLGGRQDKLSTDKKVQHSRQASRNLSKSFAKKDSLPSAGVSSQVPAGVNRKKSVNPPTKSPEPLLSSRAMKESVSVYKIYSTESKCRLSVSNRSSKELAQLPMMLSLQNLTNSDLNSLGPSPVNQLGLSLTDLKLRDVSSIYRPSEGNPTTKKLLMASPESLQDLASSETTTRQMYSKMFEQAVIDRATRKSYRHPNSSVRRNSKPGASKFGSTIPKEPSRLVVQSKLNNKASKNQYPKPASHKKDSDSNKKESGNDKLRREDSPRVNANTVDNPQKAGGEMKQTKNPNSSKGTNSSISQGTSLGRAIKVRSKSIVGFDVQDRNIEITHQGKKFRRGETVEIAKLRLEEDKDSKNEEKTEQKQKPKLRKIRSSFDVVASSTHAIILGKYCKYQSR